MNRNANPPRFTETSYSQAISETFPLVQEVIRVEAVDPDGDDITYELIQVWYLINWNWNLIN